MLEAKEAYKKVEAIFNKSNKDDSTFLSKWFFEFYDSFIFYSDNGDINKIDYKIYLVNKSDGLVKEITEIEMKELRNKYGKPKRGLVE